jgi:hypothetical protein
LHHFHPKLNSDRYRGQGNEPDDECGEEAAPDDD